MLLQKLANLWSQDDMRVELNEERDARYWADVLHCTPQELELAVGAVGNDLHHVRNRLSHRMV
jgi:hypothetical protein